MTRTVVANISLSLDGRICGPGGEYDMSWIAPHAVTDGARAHMVRLIETATTALLGRKNYQGFHGYWPPIADNPDADLDDRAFSHWLNAVPKVVFSSTLDSVDWAGARLGTDPVTTVQELRAQAGGDIVVLGSTSVIRQLLEADEVDRLSITLCPELVGGGTRLFDTRLFDTVPSATSWSLTTSTPTESGAICLTYDRKKQ